MDMVVVVPSRANDKTRMVLSQNSGVGEEGGKIGAAVSSHIFVDRSNSLS